MARHPQSPLLDHCPDGLPPAAYLDDAWYAREQKTLWRNNWVCTGRLSDLENGMMHRANVAGANIILCRSGTDSVSAFHNTCRHRGSELCVKEKQSLGKLISCPYHNWSYSPGDGRLVSVAKATPTADFRKDDHGLFPVAIRHWNGFVFVCLNGTSPELNPDIGLSALANWPMDTLVTGHRATQEIACNWKTFWDNYNECLHCPGIHPELCDMVPVYRHGIMNDNEAIDWTPDDQARRNLRTGAESWTMTGAPCGPVFPSLSQRERENGYNFVTLYPSMYVVAHVDYVRSVRIMPTGPETTRLTAEWHFPQATLDQPGFNAAEVAAFANIVMMQDAAAAEMNQRGMRSPAFIGGRLMPQEYALAGFKSWVLEEMKREFAQ